MPLYPRDSGVEQVVGEAVAIARETFGNRLRSFIVGGSYSTGEFVVEGCGEARRFYSDLDGYVVIDKHGGEDAQFSERIDALRNDCSAGTPLFYLDLSVMPRTALGRLPPTYQHCEMRTAAVVCYGDDLRCELPESWSLLHVRQVFFMNLWRAVLFSAASGTLGMDSRLVQHALARVFLDLPFLATSEAGICIPGHRARVQWLRANCDRAHLPRTALTAVDMAEAVRDSRVVPASELTPHLRGHVEGGLSLLGFQGDVWRLDRSLEEFFGRVFGRRGLRRWLAEGRDSGGDLRWLVLRKAVRAACCLMAAVAHLIGEPVRQNREQVSRWFREFSGREPWGADGEFSVARAASLYWSGLRRLYPSLNKHNSRLEGLVTEAEAADG